MRSIGDDHSIARQKKRQWTQEEDRLLMKYIEIHGEGNWRTLPQKAGLQRCGKGCRLRWKNYLRPKVKRGNISLEEEDLIIRLHKLLGNRWSLIAGRVPGRTDNEIKNYWNSHLSKKIRFKDSLEAPNHYKSSPPSDTLHLHSYEKQIIDSEILYGYNSSYLPGCQTDYLNSQQQEDHLKSSHFDSLVHMPCAFQPQTPIEDNGKRFSHCLCADCNGKDYCSQFLSTKHDVGFSIDACLQQPLPPQVHFSEVNGQVFHSMVAMQPNYCSSLSLCISGSNDNHGRFDEIWDHKHLSSDYHDHYDEIWEHGDLGCTDMQDSIITDFGMFGGDAESMNFILGWDNVHNNMNSVEQKPCHDLRTLQAVHPIISLCEHSQQCPSNRNEHYHGTPTPMTSTVNF